MRGARGAARLEARACGRAPRWLFYNMEVLGASMRCDIYMRCLKDYYEDICLWFVRIKAKDKKCAARHCKKVLLEKMNDMKEEIPKRFSIRFT